MNQDFRRILINTNNSGFGCLLTFIIVSLLLGSVGLKWVVNGVLIVIALSLITPVIAFWIFRWWLQRNLVEDKCPVCGYEFTGFNNIESRCPSCGEVLKIESGSFQRITPPGTIDVDVVEVPAQKINDENIN